MSALRRLLFGVSIAVLAARTVAAEDPLPPCRGDCNADRDIDERDLGASVHALFDPAPAGLCPELLSEGESVASAADLLASLTQRALTCEINEAPVIAPLDVYRSYTGYEIQFPIAAEDPNGPLTYEADDLPDGATLDPTTGVFHWLPEATQAGRYYIPIRVTDSAREPLTAETTLSMRIVPPDTCAIPDCDPAKGCTSTFPPITEPCCSAGPVERIPEIIADCPQGTVLMIGRNPDEGFGRLQNCDQLRLIAATQTGVFVRLHIAARCVTPRQILILKSRFATAERLHTLREDTIVLNTTSSGFNAMLNFALPVNNATMALEGQEASLTITLEDPFTGVIVSEDLRLLLTHDFIGDLPDVF